MHKDRVIGGYDFTREGAKGDKPNYNILLNPYWN
jgi:hypothetical protein